jgi:hypothetical protein
MRGATLKMIREQLGRSVADFGCDLGFQGESENIATRVRAYERDYIPIPGPHARLAELYWVLNTIPHWSPGEDGAYDVLTQEEIDRLFADDVTANR